MVGTSAVGVRHGTALRTPPGTDAGPGRVSPELLRDLLKRLEAFVEPFSRSLLPPEQRRHAAEYMTGLLSKLERKTGEAIAYLHDQKKQTDYTRSSALSILRAAPHNRGPGAPEAGRLEPATPGTVSTRRVIMRHTPSRPVPPAPAEGRSAPPSHSPLASPSPSRPGSDSPDAESGRRAATAKTSRRQGGRS